MVSCSASGCSNRGEKGFCMKSFPRDQIIRKKWQENVNRIGWEPTDNSKLCEVHFLPEMWEKPRVDGKKKLKWNAIPTIFPAKIHTKPISIPESEDIEPVIFVSTNSKHVQTEVTELSEANSDPLLMTTTISTSSTDVKDLPNIHQNSFVSQSNDTSSNQSNTAVNVENPSMFHNYAQPPNNELKKTSQGVQVNSKSMTKIDDSFISSSDFSESFVSEVNIPSTLNNADLFKKMYQYQKSYTQLLSKVNNYKEQVKMLKQRNERLVKIAKKDRHLRLLKHVFNDDQICALERTNSRFMKWTQSTLINALRLKNYCGKDGYEEILRQKIPLPSIRTLNRIKITDSVNCMIGTNFSQS